MNTRLHGVRVLLISVSAVLLLAVGLTACGGDDSSSSKAAPLASGLPTASVSVGWIPVWDDSPWWIAADEGYFADAGISLTGMRSFEFVQPSLEALARGDVDVGGGNQFAAPPIFKTLNNLRYVGVSDTWYGFAFLARKGSGMKTYEDFLKQNGGDKDAAIASVVNQFEGKKIVTQLSGDFDPIFKLAYSKANKTIHDFDYIDLPFPEGATAFLKGEGDVFSGDLPSRFRVQEDGAYPVLTGKELGPAASLAIGHIVRDDMPKDIVLKLLGIYYRAIDLIHSDPQKAFTIMSDHLNEETGAKFDANFGKFVASDISPWPTFEQAGPAYFAKSAEFNFVRMYQDAVDYWTKDGSIDAGDAPADKFAQPAPDFYKELMGLKLGTEKLLDQAKGGNADAKLVQLAKTAYQQRDYVDSEILAGRAVKGQ